MRAGLILGAALVLAGCGVIDGQDMRDAKKRVANETRDPSSVQFRDVRYVRQVDGSRAVCGEINAKNAYGGYVGFESFVYIGHRTYLQQEGADAIRKYTRHCILNSKTDEEYKAYMEESDRELAAIMAAATN